MPILTSLELTAPPSRFFVKGQEYAAPSKQKLALERAVTSGTRPFTAVASSILKLSVILTDPSIDPHFEQTRIGTDGEPFVLRKTRTLRPPENKYPINRLMEVSRKMGLDELDELNHDVPAGAMSLVGFRPLTPDQFTKMMDEIESPKLKERYRRIVLPTRPGILSSYVLSTHSGLPANENTADYHAESDIKDVIDGWVGYDLKLMRDLASLALSPGGLTDPHFEQARAADIPVLSLVE